MKSREDLIHEITETVIQNHPYEVPEVIAMPIVVGSSKYLNWVIENIKTPNQQSN